MVNPKRRTRIPRVAVSPPDPRASNSRERNSAAFCPRASCGRRTDGRTRTELVKEGEEEGMEEEAVSAAAAAPLIISSVAGGRA